MNPLVLWCHTNVCVLFSSRRWLTGFVWRCRTTWTLWGTQRQTPSWRTSGQQRASSKTPETPKRWGEAIFLTSSLYSAFIVSIRMNCEECSFTPRSIIISTRISLCLSSCSLTSTILDQHPERRWTVLQWDPFRRNWSLWLEKWRLSWTNSCRLKPFIGCLLCHVFCLV